MNTRVFIFAAVFSVALQAVSISSNSLNFNLNGFQEMFNSLESAMEFVGIGRCTYQCPKGISVL